MAKPPARSQTGKEPEGRSGGHSPTKPGDGWVRGCSADSQQAGRPPSSWSKATGGLGSELTLLQEVEQGAGREQALGLTSQTAFLPAKKLLTYFLLGREAILNQHKASGFSVGTGKEYRRLCASRTQGSQRAQPQRWLGRQMTLCQEKAVSSRQRQDATPP